MSNNSLVADKRPCGQSGATDHLQELTFGKSEGNKNTTGCMRRNAAEIAETTRGRLEERGHGIRRVRCVATVDIGILSSRVRHCKKGRLERLPASRVDTDQRRRVTAGELCILHLTRATCRRRCWAVDSACSEPLALTARPANSAARLSMNLLIRVSRTQTTFAFSIGDHYNVSFISY